MKDFKKRNNKQIIKTGLYEDKNMDLKWFGNAPFCDGDFCDAIMEGYIPLGFR